MHPQDQWPNNSTLMCHHNGHDYNVPPHTIMMMCMLALNASQGLHQGHFIQQPGYIMCDLSARSVISPPNILFGIFLFPYHWSVKLLNKTPDTYIWSVYLSTKLSTYMQLSTLYCCTLQCHDLSILLYQSKDSQLLVLLSITV